MCTVCVCVTIVLRKGREYIEKQSNCIRKSGIISSSHFQNILDYCFSECSREYRFELAEILELKGLSIYGKSEVISYYSFCFLVSGQRT